MDTKEILDHHEHPKRAKSTSGAMKGVLMLTILWFAYVMFAMNWITGSNLSPEIINTFFGGPVAPVLQQVVNYTITAARIVANFLAAFVLIKFGPKKSVTIAMVFLMFSLVAVWMPNYWGYTISRMIMALGGSMIVVYMNPVVANYIKPDKKIIANGLNTVSYNVGAFFTSILFVAFADKLKMNWQVTMTVMASFTILLLVLWLFISEDFSTDKDVSGANDGEVEYGYKEALKDSFVWKYSVAFSGFLFLYILAVTSFPAVIGKYAPSVDGSLLNMLVTGFAIGGTVVGMKIGLTDAKRKSVFMISGFMMILAYALLLLFADIMPVLSYVLAAISGFFMFIQYPVYMNLPHEMPNMSGQKLTIIFGLFWAIAYAVYTIFTIIWSLILGSAGWTAASIFYILASCLYLVVAYFLPETK